MGGGNPDLGFRPPFVKLLWRPVVKFGHRDNLLRTSGPSCCLRSDVLLQGVVEGLLTIGELEDDIIPDSHCCGLIGGSVGAGFLEMREPKSVTAGIQQRGRWDIIGDWSDEGKLEVEVVEDLVVDSSESLEFKLEVSCTEPLKESDFVIVQERLLKDVGNPLTLLCVCWRVIDVARNGGLSVGYGM